MVQLITSICCLTTALSSFSAHGFESLDQLASHQETFIQKIGCVPTSTKFKADPHTAAGTFLYSYDENGNALVLLGKRSDTHDYCTFGGKHEVSHKTVADTAASETNEESLGIYAFYPQDLALNPYIDFMDQGQFFRLYFRSVQYVPSSYLQSYLDQAIEAKNKEYDHFVWEKVSTLISLLDRPSTKLPLFAPMVNLLKTPAGQSFLESLVKKKPLQNNKFRNLLFMKNSSPKVSPKQLSQKWELVDEKTGTWRKVLYRNHIPLVILPPSSPDEKRDRLTVGRSTVAKMLVNDQIRATTPRLIPPTQPIKEWITISDLLLEDAGLRPYPSHKNGMNNPKNRQKVEKFFSKRFNTSQLKVEPKKIASRMADVLGYIHKNPHLPTFFHASTGAYHHFVLTFTRLHQLLLGSNLSNNLSLRGTDLYFKEFPNDDMIHTHLTEKMHGDRGHVLLCCNAAFTVGSIGSGDVTTSSLNLWLNDNSIRKLDFRDTFRSNATLLGLTSSYEPFESLLHQYRRQQSPNHENGVMIVFQITEDLLKKAQFEYTFKGMGLDHGEKRWKKLQSSCQDFITKKHNTLNNRDLVEFRFFMHPEIMRSNQISMKAFDLFPLSKSQERQFNQEMDRTLVNCLGQWLSMETMMIPGSLQGDIKLKKLYAYVQKHTFDHPVKERFPIEAINSLIKFKALDGISPLLEDPLNREKFLPPLLTQAVMQCAWDVVPSLLAHTPGKKITDVLDQQQLGDLVDQLGQKWSLSNSEKLLEALDLKHLTYENRLQITKLVLQKSKNSIKLSKERNERLFSLMDRLWQRYVSKHGDVNLAKHFSLKELNKTILEPPQVLATPYINVSDAPPLLKELWMERAMNFQCPKAALATVTSKEDKKAYLKTLLHHYAIQGRCFSSNDYKLIKITGDYFTEEVTAKAFFDWALKTYSQYPRGGRNSKAELFADLISFGVDLTEHDKTKQPRIFNLMTLLSSYKSTSLTNAIFKQHNQLSSLKKPTPLTIKNAENLNIIQHLQSEYLKGANPHWFLEQVHTCGEKYMDYIRTLSLPRFLKIYDLPQRPLEKYEHKADYLWLKKLYDLVEQDAPHEKIHDYVATLPTETLAHHLQRTLNEAVLSYDEIDKIFEKAWKEKKENFRYPGERLHKLWDLKNQPSVNFETIRSELSNLSHWVCEDTLNYFAHHTFIPIIEGIMKTYIQHPQEFWNTSLLESSLISYNDDYEIVRWALSKVPSLQKFATDPNLSLHNFLLTKGRTFSKLYKDFPELFTTQNVFCDRIGETATLLKVKEYTDEIRLHFWGDNLGYLTNPKKPHLFSLIKDALHRDKDLEYVCLLFKTYPSLLKTTHVDGTTVKDVVDDFKGMRFYLKHDPEIYREQMKRKKQLLEFLNEQLL